MILRFLIFLVLFYVVYNFLKRFFGSSSSETNRNSREGQVTVMDSQRGNNANKEQVGEYIDYEEIKDES